MLKVKKRKMLTLHFSFFVLSGCLTWIQFTLPFACDLVTTLVVDLRRELFVAKLRVRTAIFIY